MNPIDEAKAIPTRYWLLAGALCLVLALIPEPLAWDPLRNPQDQDVQLLLDRGSSAIPELLVFLAPLVALRWVLPATLFAVLPGVLLMVQENRLELPELVVPVAVAMVATWRTGWRALLVLLPAVAFVAVLLTGQVDLVAPDGAVNDFSRHNGSQSYTVTTFLLFVVPMVLAVVAAMWVRTTATTDQLQAALASRAAAVDADAAVVSERARLARDLHDVVAHHVSLIAVRAETAPYSEPGMTDASKDVLKDIADDARSALDELRGVLGILNRSDDEAATREPLPGIADLDSLVERALRAGEQVTFASEPVEAGATTGYVAYRVVQEALTNARKHAPGLPVTVSVSQSGGVRVVISNPLPGTEVGPERGLAGMRERVEGIGGRFLAGPHGDSFVVDVLLPLRGSA
ncbi:MAG TPA: histidine kinase [Nocardioidaceae bacterium]|nr:histidine kinase [Nocardioidaceae bacterium]